MYLCMETLDFRLGVVSVSTLISFASQYRLLLTNPSQSALAKSSKPKRIAVMCVMDRFDQTCRLISPTACIVEIYILQR